MFVETTLFSREMSSPRTTPRNTTYCVSPEKVTMRTPEIVECHRITGEDCYFMKAHVRDVTHMEEVIDVFAVYGQTTTSIVQSSPVPRRGVATSL